MMAVVKSAMTPAGLCYLTMVCFIFAVTLHVMMMTMSMPVSAGMMGSNMDMVSLAKATEVFSVLTLVFATACVATKVMHLAKQ